MAPKKIFFWSEPTAVLLFFLKGVQLLSACKETLARILCVSVAELMPLAHAGCFFLFSESNVRHVDNLISSAVLLARHARACGAAKSREFWGDGGLATKKGSSKRPKHTAPRCSPASGGCREAPSHRLLPNLCSFPLWDIPEPCGACSRPRHLCFFSHGPYRDIALKPAQGMPDGVSRLPLGIGLPRTRRPLLVKDLDAAAHPCKAACRRPLGHTRQGASLSVGGFSRSQAARSRPLRQL